MSAIFSVKLIFWYVIPLKLGNVFLSTFPPSKIYVPIYFFICSIIPTFGLTKSTLCSGYCSMCFNTGKLLPVPVGYTYAAFPSFSNSSSINSYVFSWCLYISSTPISHLFYLPNILLKKLNIL